MQRQGRKLDLGDSADKSTVAGVLGLRPVVRTPGRYRAVDDQTGIQTSIPLKGTRETIPSCVGIGIGDDGPETEEGTLTGEVQQLLEKARKLVGLNASPKHNSKALQNSELVVPERVRGEVDHARKGGQGWTG